MQGLNKAYFIGRVGRDPEQKATTQKGGKVVNLSLATANRRQTENGEWVDNPDWHRLTAFGKTADSVLAHVHKGDGLAVECVVRQDKWTDKEGGKHYGTSLVIDRVLWIQSKGPRAAMSAPATTPGTDEAGPPIAAMSAVNLSMTGERGSPRLPEGASFPEQIGSIGLPAAFVERAEPSLDDIPF